MASILDKYPPKSILKKTPSSWEPPEASDAGKTKRERDREVAIHHANIIQAQKDVETEIIAALEELIEFPTDAKASSISPSTHDIETFTKFVTPFQLSDYDDLLDERRIAGRCGYVFCRNPPKSTTSGGKFKILGKKPGQEFKVVEREKMDCWCSADCARRALYVKVQLQEEPAWTRRGGSAPRLELLIGDGSDMERAARIAEEKIQDIEKLLALERGDLDNPTRASGLMKEVVEKDQVSLPEPPSKIDSFDTIEGYEPKGVRVAIRTKEAHTRPYELGDRDWEI